MIDAKIGHTALTWGVAADPSRLEAAIRDCARLGYAGTETGGKTFDWWEQERSGQLRALLDASGLTLAGLYLGGEWTDAATVPALLEAAHRWAAALADFGGEMLVLVPGPRRQQPPYGLDDFRRMAQAMNRAGEVARRAGVRAGMHPHWGTAAETRLEVELLLSLLDPELVGFAPDTGQMAKGGADPVPIVERWIDRVRYVHLKDLSVQWDATSHDDIRLRSPEGYCELGQGVVDVKGLLSAFERAGFSGWLMAELDQSRRPPEEAAAISKRYLDAELPARR
jgi:inosose dehydratase